MARFTRSRERAAGRSRWRAMAAAACLITGVAACSTSSGPGGSGSTGGSQPPATGPVAAPGTTSSAGDVTDYPRYAGASGKANPSLPPVTMGWVNQQGGPPSQTFPEATRSARTRTWWKAAT
jgi:branched-chain amino acid transport system substrate-binding protein